MLYVNQNMERAMQETLREGFDFHDTRNQFVSTAKASFFQKTTLSAINANRRSFEDENLIGDGYPPMDVIGLGLVTQTEKSQVM